MSSPVTFEGGAKRSDAKPYYRNIPYGLMQRMAVAYSDGAVKYDEELTESNFEKGDEEFAFAVLDHIVEHVYKYIALRRGQIERLDESDFHEDHLGHAAAGLGMAIRLEELGRMPDFFKRETEVKSEDVMDGDTLLTNAEAGNGNWFKSMLGLGGK